MNPIGPAIETDAPANTITSIPITILINCVFCPNPFAMSSLIP